MLFPVPCKREGYTAGKVLAGVGSMHLREQKKKSDTKYLANELLCGTASSAGVDLSSRESVTSASSVQLVPIRVGGPLGDNILC